MRWNYRCGMVLLLLLFLQSWGSVTPTAAVGRGTDVQDGGRRSQDHRPAIIRRHQRRHQVHRQYMRERSQAVPNMSSLLGPSVQAVEEERASKRTVLQSFWRWLWGGETRHKGSTQEVLHKLGVATGLSYDGGGVQEVAMAPTPPKMESFTFLTLVSQPRSAASWIEGLLSRHECVISLGDLNWRGLRSLARRNRHAEAQHAHHDLEWERQQHWHTIWSLYTPTEEMLQAFSRIEHSSSCTRKLVVRKLPLHTFQTAFRVHSMGTTNRKEFAARLEQGRGALGLDLLFDFFRQWQMKFVLLERWNQLDRAISLQSVSEGSGLHCTGTTANASGSCHIESFSMPVESTVHRIRSQFHSSRQSYKSFMDVLAGEMGLPVMHLVYEDLVLTANDAKQEQKLIRSLQEFMGVLPRKATKHALTQFQLARPPTLKRIVQSRDELVTNLADVCAELDKWQLGCFCADPSTARAEDCGDDGGGHLQRVLRTSALPMRTKRKPKMSSPGFGREQETDDDAAVGPDKLPGRPAVLSDPQRAFEEQQKRDKEVAGALKSERGTLRHKIGESTPVSGRAAFRIRVSRGRSDADRLSQRPPPGFQFLTLVSQPRSGTTWVLDLISNHPCVVSMHELHWQLVPNMISRGNYRYRDTGRLTDPVKLEELKQQLVSAIWELYTPTQEAMRGQMRNNQCKTKYIVRKLWLKPFEAAFLSHSLGTDRAGFEADLARNKGALGLDLFFDFFRETHMKFVLLQRWNQLDRVISLRSLAQGTGMHCRGDDPSACRVGTFSLSVPDDVGQIVTQFRQSLWAFETFRSTMTEKGFPMLQLVYEDIQNQSTSSDLDTDAALMRRLYEFMGLPVGPLVTANAHAHTQKRIVKTREQQVSNLREVCDMLRRRGLVCLCLDSPRQTTACVDMDPLSEAEQRNMQKGVTIRGFPDSSAKHKMMKQKKQAPLEQHRAPAPLRVLTPES